MQPGLKLCALSWLLALRSLCAPATQGSQDCGSRSRALLRNVTEAVALDNLFKGINCSEQRAHVNTTVSACQPAPEQVPEQQAAVCSGNGSMNFNQNECLKNIMADLQHYRDLLIAYSSPTLNTTVLQAIDDVMEGSSMKEHTFDERLQMCKVLKGFRIRTITITRVLGYITAEQHRD